MATNARPAWYTDEDDTAWGRVKAAFQRDWTQTKHDFGANAPNLDQQVGDTISQATGSKPVPPGKAKTPHSTAGTLDAYNDDDEPAYRYGYAASRHFEADWDDVTESELQRDWDETEWERRRNAIRRGWDFGRNENFRNRPK